MNCSYVKSLRRTMRILSLIIVSLLSRWATVLSSDQILHGGVADAFFPPFPPRLEPGRCGPGRFWASDRYEQVIDRVDERCQLNRRARGNDLAVGDRGFIDEGRAGIFQVRLDAPPAGGPLAAGQSGIRKKPWAVADRGDDLTCCRRLLNEADRLGIATQRIGIPDAARNDHPGILLGGR